MGPTASRFRATWQNYVAGVNQYIAEARVGPNVTTPGTMIPGEYSVTGQPTGPDEWKVTDVIATASLVGGQFGKGGGNEVGRRSCSRRRPDQLRAADGRARLVSDFREREDPEAPTTVHEGTHFPYGEPPATDENVALPDAGTAVQEPVVPSSSSKAKAAQPPAFKGFQGHRAPRTPSWSPTPSRPGRARSP